MDQQRLAGPKVPTRTNSSPLCVRSLPGLGVSVASGIRKRFHCHVVLACDSSQSKYCSYSVAANAIATESLDQRRQHYEVLTGLVVIVIAISRDHRKPLQTPQFGGDCRLQPQRSWPSDQYICTSTEYYGVRTGRYCSFGSRQDTLSFLVLHPRRRRLPAVILPPLTVQCTLLSTVHREFPSRPFWEDTYDQPGIGASSMRIYQVQVGHFCLRVTFGLIECCSSTLRHGMHGFQSVRPPSLDHFRASGSWSTLSG